MTQNKYDFGQDTVVTTCPHQGLEMYKELIDRSIALAKKRGYRVTTSATFVDPYKRICCPIGAVWLAEMEQRIPRDWQRVFMCAYNGDRHKLIAWHRDAYELGKYYGKNNSNVKGLYGIPV